MSNLYRGPSIDLSYQVSVHLPNRFQRRRFFRNRPIRNKNCLWRPCLLMNRHEISNLYRGLSIDASYQVSFHLVMRFQKRRFETRIAYDRHVWKRIDTKWAIFIERFFVPSFGLFGQGVSEEKIKMWKVNGRLTTDNKRRTPSDGKSSHCLLARWAKKKMKKGKHYKKTHHK